MKPAGTFPGRQGVALRHQQSSLSWWGAGWGHWGDNPRAAPPRPPPAGHGGDTLFLRAGYDLGRGMQAEDRRVASPQLDALCPHCPAVGDSPSNSRTSPWLRGAGWGHGGGIPRARSLVLSCPPVGDTALPQAQLTALEQVCATSPALLAVRVLPAASPQADILGTMWDPQRPQPWNWGGCCAAAGLAALGSDCASHPCKQTRPGL